MSKYMKKKEKNIGLIILVVVLAVLLAGLLMLAIFLDWWDAPTPEEPTDATPQTQQTPQPEETESINITPPTAESIDLPEGLTIHDISSYAGMYMEDGSNEIVADVMMLLVENTSPNDLQLARISLVYAEWTAEFEVTNLPAGEKVVLLEKNRHPAVAEEHQSIQARNVVFFPEAMSLQEERIQITGSNGTLELKNISGEDITGDIYVYYKHSASDLLYGGITYRVAVKGGLKAGESSRIVAGHFSPDNSRILSVDCGD